jgi:hypothetical protein
MIRRLAICLLALSVACVAAAPASAGTKHRRHHPHVGHVFVIVLENENASNTFGANSPAPYLAHTLTSQGQFVPNYYGVTHLSLGNYVAMVSGQGSNIVTQADCVFYLDFLLGLPGPFGQALGQGCVYPKWVKTVGDQLTAAGRTWKGYMEDMGNDPARESSTCGHPKLNSQDHTQEAEPNDQYASRHNPFVYFHSIIDSQVCASNVVRLEQLQADLGAVETTPNYAFISPNLCHDGHDEPCVNGEPGGLVSADAFLRTWVPRITASPAFQQDGLLVVTFDEAEAHVPPSLSDDATACCNEPQFLNTINNGGPVLGRGGGRVGAVLLSPFITPGTVNQTPYNHFSLLRSVENFFRLGHLGYAAHPNPGAFGRDVFG